MTNKISQEVARRELALTMRALRRKSGRSVEAAAEGVFTEERFIQLLETPDRDVRALSPTVPGSNDRSFDTSYYRVRELCERIYAASANTTLAAEYLFLIGDAVAHEYKAQARSVNAIADERTLMNGTGCIAFPVAVLLTVGAFTITGNPIVALAVFFLGAALLPFLVRPILQKLPGSNSNPLSAEQELERDVGIASDWLARNYSFAQAEPACPSSGPEQPPAAEANASGKAPGWAQFSAAAPNSFTHPTPSNPTRSTPDLYEALLKLNELRERGILSEQEFQEQKAQLLQSSTNQHHAGQKSM